VEVWRGEAVESLHTVVASVVDAEGREVERYGDPDFVTFWRSAAKPFQEHAWVEDGTIDHWGWGSREMAIIASSHVGSDEHAALVRRMSRPGTGEEPALRRGSGAAQLPAIMPDPGLMPHRWDCPAISSAGTRNNHVASFVDATGLLAASGWASTARDRRVRRRS
jgi:hypothetical protein